MIYPKNIPISGYMCGLIASTLIFVGLLVPGNNISQAQSDSYNSNQIVSLGSHAVCDDPISVRLVAHDSSDIVPRPIIVPSQVTQKKDTPQHPTTCHTAQQVSIQIPMYHYVRPSRRDAQHSVVWNNSITPEEAADHYAHLAQLQQQGKTLTVFLSELEEFERTDCFPHTNITVLTFDDGWRDNYEFLLPLAKQYNVKANLGIIVDRLSRDPKNRIDSFMTYQEIVEMKDSGWFEIQSHSLTHTDLKQKSYDMQRQEICGSTKQLEKIFGVEISTFIYPMGLYNQHSMNIVRDCGLTYGLSTRDGVNYSGDLTWNRYQLNRTRVIKDMTGGDIYGW